MLSKQEILLKNRIRIIKTEKERKKVKLNIDLPTIIVTKVYFMALLSNLRINLLCINELRYTSATVVFNCTADIYIFI